MAGNHQLRRRVWRRRPRAARLRRRRSMVRRKAVALAAFAAAAAGGAALGWAGERRLLRYEVPAAEPDWRDLRKPVRGRPRHVESFDGTRLYVDVVGSEDAP